MDFHYSQIVFFSQLFHLCLSSQGFITHFHNTHDRYCQIYFSSRRKNQKKNEERMEIYFQEFSYLNINQRYGISQSRLGHFKLKHDYLLYLYIFLKLCFNNRHRIFLEKRCDFQCNLIKENQHIYLLYNVLCIHGFFLVQKQV